jgi:CRP/FNR family transcriptional regulator
MVQWTDDFKVKALKKTILFKDISEQDLQELIPFSRIIRLEIQQILFSAGQRCEGLFVVLKGRTRAVRHGTDGREQVIHEDGPYSTYPEVAVFDNGPCPSTVIALEESDLLLIPKVRVIQFCLQHPQVALAALRVISKRLRKTAGMVEDLSLKGVSQRLAEFLLEQAHSCDTEANLVLMHSNQEIADTIGSVREVVSRAFSKMQRNKWIEKDGRFVKILDQPALEEHIHGGME